METGRPTSHQFSRTLLRNIIIRPTWRWVLVSNFKHSLKPHSGQRDGIYRERISEHFFPLQNKHQDRVGVYRVLGCCVDWKSQNLVIILWYVVVNLVMYKVHTSIPQNSHKVNRFVVCSVQLGPPKGTSMLPYIGSKQELIENSFDICTIKVQIRHLCISIYLAC